MAALEREAAERKKREMEAAKEEKKGGEVAKPRAAAILFKPSGYVPPAPTAAKQIPKPPGADAKTFTTS